jgi:hypothetical protein
MNPFAKRAMFSVIIALGHAAASGAIGILAYIGSLGAPQGGAAGYVYTITGPKAVLMWILQTVMQILWFPASLLADTGLSPLTSGVCNSLFWGIAIVAIMDRITKMKKSNQTVEPTR